jgi:uncharacterized protein (TIRG00374 family)
MTPKRVLLIAFKFALSLGILSYLFYQEWSTDQFDDLWATKKNWNWIAVGFLICVAAHLISFFRWKLMVRALDLPFSYIDAVRIGLIGMFFGLFAFGVVGGDTLRAYYAARQSKNKIPEAIASVVADRFVGMLTMFSFASIAFLALGTSNESAVNPEKLAIVTFVFRVVLLATAIGLAGVVMLLFAPRVRSSAWFLRLTRVPRIGGAIGRLAEVVILYRSKLPLLVTCVLLSAVINVGFVVVIYCIARGLGGSHPSFASHFLIAPMSMAANAIPLPGGIGGMEFMLTYLYDALSLRNMPSEHGVIVSFTFRLMLLLLSAFGAIAWFANRRQLHEIVEMAKPH